MVNGKMSTLFGLLMALGSTRACYYSAMNMEAPADYYYRHCNVGCSTLDHEDAIVGKCCFPLGAGASAPGECSSVMSSHWAAGTTCPYPSNIGTTDFPNTYQYQSTSAIPSGQAGVSAEISQGACATTVWVTSTTTTDCSASSAPSTSVDEGMNGISAISSIPPPAPSSSQDAIASCTPCVETSSTNPLVEPSVSCQGDSCPSQGALNPDSFSAIAKRNGHDIPCCPSPSSSLVPSSGMAGVSAELSQTSSCESVLIDTSQGCTGPGCPSQGAAPHDYTIQKRDTTTITARAVHATPHVKRMMLDDSPLPQGHKRDHNHHHKRGETVTVETIVTVTTDDCAGHPSTSTTSSGTSMDGSASSTSSGGGLVPNSASGSIPSGQPSQGAVDDLGPPIGFTYRKRNNPPVTVTNTITHTSVTACAQPSTSSHLEGALCPYSGLVDTHSTSSGQWQGAGPEPSVVARRGYGRYRRGGSQVSMCPCASVSNSVVSIPSGLVAESGGVCTGAGCPSQGALNPSHDVVRRAAVITARPAFAREAVIYQNSSCITFGCPTATRREKRDNPTESLSSLTQWLWPGMAKRAWDTWDEQVKRDPPREVLGRALPPLDPSNLFRRNEPTNVCTSTTWITTDNCAEASTPPPAPSPSASDDEWCDEDETTSVAPSSGMAGVSAVASSSGGALVSQSGDQGSQGAAPEPTPDF